MGNSIVDLGAAAFDYASDAMSDFVDYMTGSPEASASETYIERKSRKGQQLYSGRDPQKPFFDFAQGGIVGQLGELGTMSAEMSDELSMLVNGTPAGGGGFSELAFPTEGNPGTADKAYETKNIFDNPQQGPSSTDFFGNPLPVASGNPPRGEEGKPGYAGNLVQPNPFKTYKGGSSTFDEGANSYLSSKVSAPYDPGQLGINPPGSRPPGFYDNDPLQKSISDGNSPYSNNPFPDLFPDQRPQPLSYGIGSTTYGFEEGGDVPLPDELAYTQGMNNPVQLPEEAGIGSFFMDTLTGNSPSDKLNSLRESGRMDNELGKALYGDGPTFMEQLVKKYNYPANIPMQDADGYAIMDPDTGMQKMMMATDMGLPEYMRTGRPRPDMPTYGELEDARAHALGAAELSRIYGPETARTLSNIKEFSEMAPLLGSSKYKDVRMDTRNNAVGVNLLKKAGIAATPQQLARMVDQKVFTQLDRILDRKEERRKTPAKDQPFAEQYFKSPEGGLDVYFPRDEEGYFDTSYIYDSGKMPKIGRN